MIRNTLQASLSIGVPTISRSTLAFSIVSIAAFGITAVFYCSFSNSPAARPIDTTATPSQGGGRKLPPDQKEYAEKKQQFSKLPLHFVQNKGQVDSRVKFFARGGGAAAYVTQEGLTLKLVRSREVPIADPADLTTKYGVRDVVACGVGYTFVEANQDSTVEANDVQQGVENYSIGNDPSKWARECKTYGFVTHKNVYDGIDIKYYERDEKLEYDVILKEGADLDQVRIQCSGLKNMRIDESGALVGETPFGELRQEKPVAFVEDVTGRKRNINCRFQLTGQDCYGFVADDVRHGDRLTVDPGLLIFGKFLGGTGIDKAHGIAVEANGNSYVTGETASINFPMQGGLGFPVSDNTYNTNTDFFISKINALGRALIYSTYWVFRNLCG